MRFNKLGKCAVILLPALAWLPVAALLSFEGAWMDSKVKRGDHSEFMNYAKQTMLTELEGNGALVLIENGKVVEQYYQAATSSNNTVGFNVNGDTLFPTASMSKLIAALAIHELAKQQKIKLSDPVGKHISRWHLPQGDYDADDVTVARLLSHTAGLTDGLGFGDYTEDEILPSVIDTLRNPRSTNGKKVIEVGIQPGSEFQYSGGGYLILELLIEEATGESYESWVKSNILEPNGLRRSHFKFIDSVSNSSAFYDSLGRKVPSFQYASSAATAFNATAIDLVSLLQSIIADPQLIEVLSMPMAEVMGAPIWGQGAMLYAPVSDDKFIIGHDGSNDPAINTSLRLNPETGDGYIALISGGQTLASEIGFEWVLWQSGKPDFIYADRAITSSFLPMLVGGGGWIVLCFVYFRLTNRIGK